jgi:hypothetical protein
MAKYWSHRMSDICTVICAFAVSGRSEIANINPVDFSLMTSSSALYPEG